MCVDSAQEADNSDEKGWREVKMAYIMPKGRGVGIETFTFARGSVPRIAWFANAVVSSNSIEAQSIFITVVLICDTLIMFWNEEYNLVTQRYIFKLYLHLGYYIVSFPNTGIHKLHIKE